MQPWHETGGDPVIDLGAVDGESTWEPAATPAPVPPSQPATRWLLVTVTAVLTAVITLAGVLLVQRWTAADETPATQMPNTTADLMTWVADGAPPNAVGEPMLLYSLGGPPAPDVSRVVRPGSYRLHLRCGMLGADARRVAPSFDIMVISTAGTFMVSVPCPSTLVRMEHVLTFTDLGGVTVSGYLATADQSAPYAAAVWIVPEAVN